MADWANITTWDDRIDVLGYYCMPVDTTRRLTAAQWIYTRAFM